MKALFSLCPSLQISIFESRFSDDDMKVMAVDLSTKARNRKDIPRSNSGLNNFFNRFSTTIISDDKSFNAFVMKVVKLFPQVTERSKLSPDVKSQQLQRESLTLLQVRWNTQCKCFLLLEGFIEENTCYVSVFTSLVVYFLSSACERCNRWNMLKNAWVLN